MATRRRRYATSPLAPGSALGLLYRYFPSKRAIVLALCDELSDASAREAAELPRGRWRDRFIAALESSFRPHIESRLRALVPVMVGDVEEGVSAASSTFSRRRVQAVFRSAVGDATDAPPRPLAELSAACSICCTSRCSCGGC